MTCFTPLVPEAMRSVAERALLSGTLPVMVTMPFLVLTSTVADFRSGSENIFALMPVVMELSSTLLQAKRNANARSKEGAADFDRSMNPPKD